jgi:hypothetical protein
MPPFAEVEPRIIQQKQCSCTWGRQYGGNAWRNAENWIGSSGWLVSAKLRVTLMVQFFLPRAFDFTNRLQCSGVQDGIHEEGMSFFDDGSFRHGSHVVAGA